MWLPETTREHARAQSWMSVGASTAALTRMPAAMSAVNFRVRMMVTVSALFAVVPSVMIFTSIRGDNIQSDHHSFEVPLWYESTSDHNLGESKQARLLTSPQVKATACTDAALHYNLHSKSWGVFSRLKPRPSAESLLQTSNSFWVTVNWISLPRYEGNREFSAALEKINEMQSREPTSRKTMKLLITDSADRGSGYHTIGHPLNMFLWRLSDMVGPDNVYLASRGLVFNRNLNCFRTKNCDHKTVLRKLGGEVRDYDIIGEKNASSYFHNGIVAKWDFCVRETYFPVFDRVIRRQMGMPENATVTADDFYRHPRELDVAHLWDVTTTDPGVAFRNMVSISLRRIMHAYNLTGTAGLVSPRGRVGRQTTSDSYAEALLGHKIIIVAQRDQWEDHIRLFESLSAGAMVLSDPLTHPPAGLVHGRNVVFYESLDDMFRKILYYIKDEEGQVEREHIARAGRELVLEHHQNHHRYERLMLGDNWPKSRENPVAPLLNCE